MRIRDILSPKCQGYDAFGCGNLTIQQSVGILLLPVVFLPIDWSRLGEVSTESQPLDEATWMEDGVIHDHGKGMLRHQRKVVSIVIDALPLVLVFLEGSMGISIIELEHQTIDGVPLQADFHTLAHTFSRITE